LPIGFVVKNGSNTARARLGVHSDALVPHHEHHVLARRQRRGDGGARRIGIRQLEGQTAAIRHCVTRI
jgi:hypothetical protein